MDNRTQKIVLVADDDEDARTIVKLGVEMLGFSVVEAEDGSRAIEELEKHSPDLAILDLMMPGLTGTEVCVRIKKNYSASHIPVLMLTALGGLDSKVSAFEGGADDYLTKPFQIEELQARVKALMRVRELTLGLQEKNRELMEMQNKLVQQERQLLLMQLAGTAAHQLGQPLSAIMLNSHLLERLPAEDPRFKKALNAISEDAKRMADLLEKLKTADAESKQEYHAGTQILNLKD